MLGRQRGRERGAELITENLSSTFCRVVVIVQAYNEFVREKRENTNNCENR